MPSILRTLGLAAIVAAVSTAASAAPVFFTDRATFQANTGALTTESLDDITTTGGTSTVQPTGVTITGAGGAEGFGQAAFDVFTSEGSSNLRVRGWFDGASLTFLFDAPVSAFGIDFLDDTGTFDMDLAVNGAIGSFVSNLVHRTDEDGPLFLGVIDAATPFTQLVISTNADNGIVNFDFLQFETADVPAPATLALLGFSLAGLGAIARRRRKAA